MLGVAVVGLGVGEQHALAYQRNRRCELRWLYDLNEARVDEVSMRLGAGRKAKSWQAILGDDTVDIVSIASFDDMHFTQVVEALQAHKHVFVEKPLCRSVAELRAIKEAWRRSERHLASNLVLRAAPLYQWLQNAVSSGALGDVYAFDGDYLYGRLHKITAGWRRNVENYSVMQGGGIHLVDLMLLLTGQRPVTAAAAGNHICTAATPFRYNDLVAATFTFASGLIGRITANFGCVHRHQHVLRVFGTKSTFIYDDAGPRLHTSRDPDAAVRSLAELSPLPASKGELIPAFVDAILDGSNGTTETQHELDVMSVCLAADAAVGAAQPVSVEYV